MLIRLGAIMSLVLLLPACSTGQLVARGAAPLIDNGVTAMNRETDLGLAQASMPANLKMLEALLIADPGNTAYQVQAAMGFYGYTLAFVEPGDPDRAASLYRRARAHALVALERAGMSQAAMTGDPATFERSLATLKLDAVPALFWTASSWGKWIELQLDDPARLAELPRVEAMMQRVLALDEAYYYGGAHLFFGAYYGGRAPMFGGDFERSAKHFDRAAALNHNQLLLVEVYRARYLLRQMGEREAFHVTLSRVLDAPEADPELNLANAVAKQQAAVLLAQEKDLF
ncbi:MAG: TRAP transporter TatT component family protein [Thiobacillus sp.]|nr:TRAP transporter TatT component family protein [Thiobacillus sp.]MDP3125923.1 TRAP transporter TatT component family protein [Thiobacillus sp.]